MLTNQLAFLHSVTPLIVLLHDHLDDCDAPPIMCRRQPCGEAEARWGRQSVGWAVAGLRRQEVRRHILFTWRCCFALCIDVRMLGPWSSAAAARAPPPLSSCQLESASQITRASGIKCAFALHEHLLARLVDQAGCHRAASCGSLLHSDGQNVGPELLRLGSAGCSASHPPELQRSGQQLLTEEDGGGGSQAPLLSLAGRSLLLQQQQQQLPPENSERRVAPQGVLHAL